MAAERRERVGADDAGGAVGHDHAHGSALFLQTLHEVAGFVGRDAAGDADEDVFLGKRHGMIRKYVFRERLGRPPGSPAAISPSLYDTKSCGDDLADGGSLSCGPGALSRTGPSRASAVCCGRLGKGDGGRLRGPGRKGTKGEAGSGRRGPKSWKRKMTQKKKGSAVALPFHKHTRSGIRRWRKRRRGRCQRNLRSSCPGNPCFRFPVLPPRDGRS